MNIDLHVASQLRDISRREGGNLSGDLSSLGQVFGPLPSASVRVCSPLFTWLLEVSVDSELSLPSPSSGSVGVSSSSSFSSIASPSLTESFISSLLLDVEPDCIVRRDNKSGRERAMVRALRHVVQETEQITCAVEHGDLQAVKSFLKKGGHPCLRNLKGSTLLHLAARLGQTQIITLLCSRALPENLEVLNARRLTPLLLACEHAQFEAALVLVLHGASPLARSHHASSTPLHYLLRKHPEPHRRHAYLTLVSELIRCAGPSVDSLPCNSQKETPLHLAVIFHNALGAAFLLQRGADPRWFFFFFLPFFLFDIYLLFFFDIYLLFFFFSPIIPS